MSLVLESDLSALEERILDLEDMVSRSDKFAGATLVYQLQQKEKLNDKMLEALKSADFYIRFGASEPWTPTQRQMIRKITTVLAEETKSERP